MIGSQQPPSFQEQAMIELTQWLGRVLQYSTTHPGCVQLGERMHGTLGRAISQVGLLEVGVLKDNLVLGTITANHTVLRTRTAPYLHERGVLVLKFGPGVTLDELTHFVGILTLPPQDIFAAGGLSLMLAQRRVHSIQVEEIAHEITDEEREEDRRTKRLREFFEEMLRRILSKQSFDAAFSARLAELLEYPDLAARMLEAQSQADIAEAVAGMSMMALRDEQATGVPLQHKMREVIMNLSADARDRVLIGFLALAGDFRESLGIVVDGFTEEELAAFALPSLRRRPHEIDVVIHALASLTPGAGRRLSTMRRLGQRLHDLPLDEPSTAEILEALAEPGAAKDVHARERACLGTVAGQLQGARNALLTVAAGDVYGADAFTPAQLARLHQRTVADVVKMGSWMVDFPSFCDRIPNGAKLSTAAGRPNAVVGLVRGLTEIREGRWVQVASATLEGLAREEVAGEALREVVRSVATEGEEDLGPVFRVFALHQPEPLLDLLARSENRKVRRMLLDALSHGGAKLAPLVRARLSSPQWFVVRNMVTLLGRVGTVEDLRPVAAHGNMPVRMEIVRALRSLTNDPGASDLLVSFLFDSATEVRAAALASLSEFPLSSFAVMTLADLASRDEHAAEVRRRAVQVLGRSKNDSAAEALFRLIEPRGLFELPSTTAVREQAAVALRTSPAPSAQRLFEAGLRAPAWRVRKTCEKARVASDE
jgi:hypothetical protein